MHYVYFLRSQKNSKLYVGYSQKAPSVRLVEHNKGSNKWTKQNGPFKLIYYESYICEEDGRNREKFYKTGFGKKIKKVISDSLDS